MGLPDKDKPLTYSDYLRGVDNKPFEVFDGKIIGMSPSSTPRHQHILGGIYAEFRAFLKGKSSFRLHRPYRCMFVCPSRTYRAGH